jgi:hypothetical protein
VLTYTSADAGKTWRRASGPAVAGGSCAIGDPHVAIDGDGRDVLAFLAGQYCGDNLTPYLVVSSRDRGEGRWGLPVRVAPAAWKYGFDDGPALAVDPRAQRVYVAWTRSLGATRATTVVSSSGDGGSTWTAPVEVSEALDHPHLASLAVGAGGDVYVAGIDAKLGVWVSRSVDGGRTFGAPRAAAPLAVNPAAGCSLAAQSPLPHESSACAGPDPTVTATRDGVYVVYGDVGVNRSQDVFVSAFGPALDPRFRAQVNPPDRGKAAQFYPAAAADPSTGVLWACWYDTTYDPDAHRAWFTCSASRNGKRWGSAERASSDPTGPAELFAIGRENGLRPAVAAGGGVAHAFWADGRIVANEFDVFTAALPQGPALQPAK